MSTVHIIQSAVEVIGVLLAAYAVYRLSAIKETDKPQKPRTEAHSDKAVVFTGKDIWWIERE
jgi:uncharacterized YccA/Bax inhibitor family protein